MKIILIEDEKHQAEIAQKVTEKGKIVYFLYLSKRLDNGKLDVIDGYDETELYFHHKFSNAMIDIKEYIQLGFKTSLKTYDFGTVEKFYKFLDEKGTRTMYENLLKKYSEGE